MIIQESKIMNLEAAARWAAEFQQSGKKLAVTNGVFDLLHRGHAEYLTRAAEGADGLLVAINSDAAVRQLKGPERPVVCEADRAYLLASLECVSAVVVFDGAKAADVFRVIHPDIYVKGGDYTEDTLDREEYALLKAGGASFRFIPFVNGKSTTSVIKQIRGDAQAADTAGSAAAPIFGRRSVRRYQLRPVGREKLTELLKAGAAAPSACCCDPWEFVVIDEPELLKKVSAVLPNGAFLEKAAAGIAVCGDLTRAHGGELSYLLQDCSAATENILIAASMLGLGACWLGVHPRQERMEKLGSILGIPEQVIPVSLIALGWPGEFPASRTRFNPDRCGWNGYDKK